ncbi:MAG: MBL fold metallo-hydrolase [candidate division Zixibacteria bacterium]|nr:MBL fold metallo-hydrolase [candidate division Zixibacteria bacterium]
MMQITFHGAAGTVTGSKYLVTVNDKKILVDCGMFQGSRDLRERNWLPVPFAIKEISAVILTHAHIDHIGFLPKLVREGYNSPIYATPPTVELSHVSLMDTAMLQMEDAQFRQKKHLSRHEVVLPLFDIDDAEATKKLFRNVKFHEWVSIGKEFRFRYHIAGHLLGAAGVELEMDDGVERKSIFFSGDVGRYGNPLTTNPLSPPHCDYLVCESTYGGKMHPAQDAHTVFEELINEVHNSRSILLIPAFAIGRTQQITYLVNDLITNDFVPPIHIHIDSPMAISATEIYIRYPTYHSIDLNKLGGAKSVLDGDNVTLHRTRKSSQTLNELRGPAIIMSSSGMMTGGRILHHLLNRLPDRRTTVALVGFMAEGTLGRRLADGAEMVYIHKMPVDVRARIVKFEGMSGHADWYELLHWLEPVKYQPKKVFITHGESEQSAAMALHLKDERGWETIIPKLDETHPL